MPGTRLYESRDTSRPFFVFFDCLFFLAKEIGHFRVAFSLYFDLERGITFKPFSSTGYNISNAQKLQNIIGRLTVERGI